MLRRSAVLTAAVLFSSCAAGSVPASGTAARIGSTRPERVWALTQTSLAMIDAGSGRLVKTIRLRCNFPTALAITPSGRAVYVACAHSVIPVRAASGTPQRAIRLPGGRGQLADDIVITPNGKHGYVAAGNTVVPISIRAGRAGTPIVVAGRNDGPSDLAVTPDGRTIYALNAATVVPVDVRTNTAGRSIRTGPAFVSMVITPDGRTAYVLGAGHTVIPINTATNTAGKPIALGRRADPYAIAVTPDGATVYVANFDSGTVEPIATATNKAGQPITVGSAASFIAITPDGATAYVATWRAIYPIDTATNTAGRPINVTFHPAAIAITPSGATAWVAGFTIARHHGLNAPGHGYALPIRTATGRAGRAIRFGKATRCLVTKPWRSGHATGPASCSD